MLMMLAAGRWIGKKGFPADAHDGGRCGGPWIGKKGFQLMLMMLAAGRWIGKRVSS